MDDLLKILILLLLIILIILLLGILAVAIFLYKKKFFATSSKQEKRIEYNCYNHPQIPSTGTCSICNKTFCETCLKEFEKLNFCTNHYQLFLKHEWDEIDTVKTTPDQPEKALYLYRFKEKIWAKDNIPTYIITHYKINIDDDHIESHVKLFARKEEVVLLKEKLKEEGSQQAEPTIL